jgi:hypothetical protein
VCSFAGGLFHLVIHVSAGSVPIVGASQTGTVQSTEKRGKGGSRQRGENNNYNNYWKPKEEVHQDEKGRLRLATYIFVDPD